MSNPELMLRDVFLYAINICCSYWLIKKAALAYGKETYNQAGNPSKDTEKEGQSQGNASRKMPGDW